MTIPPAAAVLLKILVLLAVIAVLDALHMLVEARRVRREVGTSVPAKAWGPAGTKAKGGGS